MDGQGKRGRGDRCSMHARRWTVHEGHTQQAAALYLLRGAILAVEFARGIYCTDPSRTRSC